MIKSSKKMFDFLIWSKIVRDSSLSNQPFFTRIYKAQRRVWASHGRLVPSSSLYRVSQTLSDTRMCDVYIVFKNCVSKVETLYFLSSFHGNVTVVER